MLVAAVDIGTGSARAGLFDRAGRLLGRAEAPIDVVETADGHAEQSSLQNLAGRRRRRPRRPGRGGRGAGAGRRPRLRRHLLARPARSRRPPAHRLDQRRRRARHHALARPPRDAGGRGDQRRRSPCRPRPCRRGAVAGDAAAEAALDQAPPARGLGADRGWPSTSPTSSPSPRPATPPARSARWPASGATWRTSLRAGRRTSSRASASTTSSSAPASPCCATPVGADLGPLTAAAAADLGLTPRTRVAAGLVDAHAGALGVLGPLDAAALERQLALIGGTSTCVMAYAAEPRAIPAIWGPSFGATPARPVDERGRAVGLGRASRPSPPPPRPRGGSRRPCPRHRPRAGAARRGAGSRAAPPRPARLPRQPLAARRPPGPRRRLGPAARRLLRRALPPLLAHLRRARPRGARDRRVTSPRTACPSTRCTSPAATRAIRC